MIAADGRKVDTDPNSPTREATAPSPKARLVSTPSPAAPSSPTSPEAKDDETSTEEKEETVEMPAGPRPDPPIMNPLLMIGACTQAR